MNVAVLGAGTMGSGIAQIAASNGCRVFLYDINTEALEQSHAKLEKILNRLIEKERIDQDKKKEILSNIHYVSTLQELSSADLVIEAIVENLQVKKKVFQELEKLVKAETILASNTSSLSITSIAASLIEPQRCIGIHFFNPAPIMKLVEIVPGLQTSDESLSKVTDLINQWGKVTVQAKDTPGFIVNRVARPFYSESIRILEEGEGGLLHLMTIDMAMKIKGNFRMGPFELMDFIGHDVNYAVTESMYNAYHQEARYKPSFTQKRLVEAGRLGRKSSWGFYKYNPDERETIQMLPDPQVLEKIADRVIIMLINEAAEAAFYRIADIKSIDKAMTKGVNYPKGLLQWADEIGIQNCVDRMDALYDRYREERYRCSPILRDLANEGKTFYS